MTGYNLNVYWVDADFELKSTGSNKASNGGNLNILVGALSHRDALRMAAWKAIDRYWNNSLEETVGKFTLNSVEKVVDVREIITDADIFLPHSRLIVPENYDYHTKQIPKSISLDTSEAGEYYESLIQEKYS